MNMLFRPLYSLAFLLLAMSLGNAAEPNSPGSGCECNHEARWDRRTRQRPSGRPVIGVTFNQQRSAESVGP